MYLFLLLLFIWCTVKCVHRVHAVKYYLFLVQLHTERTGKDRPTQSHEKRNYFMSFEIQLSMKVHP